MFSLLGLFGVSYTFHQHEEKAFLAWMRLSNNYFTSGDYKFRFGIWLSNSRFVREHNKVKDYQLEMNRYACYTPSEYYALLGLKLHVQPNRNVMKSKFLVGDELDYRKKGVVNDIKDQGSCGSCWAFSAIQSVESVYALKTGKLLSLSEQNLVDCVTKCNGCYGGLMNVALDYVIEYQHGKFNKESDYPYIGHKKSCSFDAQKAVASISSYIHVVKDDEDDLQAKIAQYGPASVAIDASHYTFQLYRKGIYNEKECSLYFLNHGVGCVGFGKENNIDYWIVRNSFGTTWGENGYIRMSKNKNNQCGIASMAIIPLP